MDPRIGLQAPATQLGPDRSGPDRSGPVRTGPDRSGRRGCSSLATQGGQFPCDAGGPVPHSDAERRSQFPKVPFSVAERRSRATRVPFSDAGSSPKFLLATQSDAAERRGFPWATQATPTQFAQRRKRHRNKRTMPNRDASSCRPGAGSPSQSVSPLQLCRMATQVRVAEVPVPP